MIPILAPNPIAKPPVSAGLALWLDATTTPLGVMTRWVDKSGNGNNLAPVTVSQQPRCTANQQGGQSAALLPGAIFSTMLLPTALTAVPAAANTVFAVAKRNADVNAIEIIFNQGTGSGNTKHGLFFANVGEVIFRNDNSSTSGVKITGISTNNFHIIQASYNGVTGLSLAVDNGVAVTSTNGAASSGITASYLGSRNNEALFLDGAIAELIMFNRLLSGSEIILMNQYLSTKYNITIS